MATADGPTYPRVGAGLGESLSLHDGTEKLNSSAVNRILMEFLVYFGRAIFVLYPVYLTGYLGLSVSWVLLCMAMATWWKKNRQRKDARIGTAIDFVNNETRVVNQELQSALQMVHFPDVEKVDWVNKVLQQAWPFFGMYMEKLLKENIQPAIRLSSPALKMFTFTKVHFGHIPLRITGMKAYTDEVDHREVVLDLNIWLVTSGFIIWSGVKGLQLKGMIRVILEPLIGQAPLVGGVTFFFIRRPTLQINWTGMTNLLDSPAFSSLSEETIMDIIASLMVLPNRMCVPLIDQVKVDEMRFPLPRGVVRVHLLEARDLLAKDTFMMGLVKGKSDPYATLRVGNRHFKSKIVKENLHPKWNEVYEFVVHEAPGQELEMEVYDEDTDKDDLLGTLQWFSLKTDPSLLMKVASLLLLFRPSTFEYTFVLYFYYTRHCLLFAQVAFASKDPVWEQGFTFFVHNVQTQQLLVQVKVNEKKTELGVLRLPLSRLLTTSDMTLDQRFQLERSGVNSQIKLKATLRILSIEKPPPKIILKPPPEDKQQGPQTNQGGNAPASTPSANTSSSPAISSNTGLAAWGDNQNGSDETWQSPSSLSHMRRYDSQSLLSENSIASSRFDLSDGASFPEWVYIWLTSYDNPLCVPVACRNIFRFSENGTDSYVRLYFLPDQTWIHRKRTHVKKRTVDPVFNHKFEFDVSLQEAQTRKLDVAVKNGKMFHSRDRKDIGMVMVDLSQLDIVKGVTEWYGA
uniref:Extended synaptotagmin-like protein 3 n=1 Tax=Cyclopterus lumpus TaxID=8103 RepID=A0A8C3A725_CYCLU